MRSIHKIVGHPCMFGTLMSEVESIGYLYWSEISVRMSGEYTGRSKENIEFVGRPTLNLNFEENTDYRK